MWLAFRKTPGGTVSIDCVLLFPPSSHSVILIIVVLFSVLFFTRLIFPFFPSGISPSNWGPLMTSDEASGRIDYFMFAVTSVTTNPANVPWTTTPDDTVAISSSQLSNIQSAAQQYLANYANGAHSAGAYIELGIEENLSANFFQPFYFANLKAKAQAVRQAAANAGASNIKLVYQV